MRVCLVSHSSLRGGGERSLLETLEALSGRGVTCAVLLPRRGPLCDELDRMGVAWEVLPYRWWVGPENGPRWRRAARLLWDLAWSVPASLRVRRWEADLVYTNTLTVPVGALAALLSGRPHVWHVRELGHEHNRMVFDLGERASLALMGRLSAMILANSGLVAERYRHAFGAGRLAVVDQAVTPSIPEAAAEMPAKRGFRCVAVGALSPAKRQEEAIEALARLRAAGREADLLVIGSGDPRYEARLRSLASRLGLKERVAFLGEVETAWPYLRDADAVIQASRHEAFGRVTVEGMLARRPVVGARSGGTTELIRDGVTGYLYEPGDVEALASILERLIDDPEAAAQVGARAGEWASRRFNARRYGETLLRWLEKARETV